MKSELRKSKREFFSPVDHLSILGELEKACKIQSVTMSNEARVSTGILCLDLVIGGGVTAGFTVIAGKEQSAKTTTAINILASSVKQNVQMRALFDAEGSSGSSGDYMESVFKSQGVESKMDTIFGSKVKGKYEETPLVYYQDDSSMDTFFNWLSGLLRRLPDKRFEDGAWWYVYEATPENKTKFRGKLDLQMSRSNSAVYIPAEDGALQAIILLDSLPSLLPKSRDQDDPKSGMALQAREFSLNLPRVKGYLRSKRVALIATNQIRTAPGVMYGDPSYEPCGEAIKFNSDVRLRNTPRALSAVPYNPKGKGQYEEEESVTVEGGKDQYRYIHSKAIKNKLSVPNRETWLRLWVQDGNLEARGFDPVWDVFYIMHLTGQLSGKRHSILLNVHGVGPAKKNLTWNDFKLLILGTKGEKVDICKRIGYRPMDLRKGMFKLMANGTLEELYVSQSKEKSKSKDTEEEEVEED